MKPDSDASNSVFVPFQLQINPPTSLICYPIPTFILKNISDRLKPNTIGEILLQNFGSISIGIAISAFFTAFSVTDKTLLFVLTLFFAIVGFILWGFYIYLYYLYKNYNTTLLNEINQFINNEEDKIK